MLSKACRSFFTLALILSTTSYNQLALADSFIVDGSDSGRVSWRGPWLGCNKQPAPTWEGTLTFGNLSGATAALTFTGTSIEVFGALKPVGVWSMQSQYVIDGREPTTVIPPPEVHTEAYNQSFYYSGRLPPGQHTLKITNLGAQLWLDYFLVTNDEGQSTASSGTSNNLAPAMTTSTTTFSATTASVTSPSTATASDSIQSATENTSTGISASTSSTKSSDLLTLSRPNVSATSPSITDTHLLSSLLPSSPSTAPNFAPGMSHAVLVGFIAGVTVASIIILGMLLAFFCWCYRKRRRSLLPIGAAANPFNLGSAVCCEDTPTQSHRNGSICAMSFGESESQYSATLLGGPRLSRPVSPLTAIVAQPRYADRESKIARRRSRDGGVTIAGGPGLDAEYAPSISEAQSIKSRLPPAYRAYGSSMV